MRQIVRCLPVAILVMGALEITLDSHHSWADTPQGLPQSVQSALAVREYQFAKTTFLWDIAATKSQPSPDPKDLAKDQESVAQQAENRAKKMGMTEDGQIRAFVQKELKVVQNAEEGFNFHFTDHWRFSNNDQTTEVLGRNQFTPSAFFDYYERYENKQALIARTDSKLTGVAYAWATSGKSTQFFSPFQDSLNLSPEDFVLLAGKNPLEMYAATWKVASSSDNALVLETQQTSGAFTPFQLSMTLDPKHGYVPSHIYAKGKIWAAEYTVNGYHHDKKGWMPVHVTVDEHWFDLQVHRELTLTAASPSAPVLSKALNLSVVDYRLIGDNPLTAQVENADHHQDPRIITYPWSGNFSSLGELRKLHQQQHPGEALPDPGQSTSTPPGVASPS